MAKAPKHTTTPTKQEPGEGRNKALEAVMGQIEKSYGKGAIMRLDQNVNRVEAISTGAPSLDAALGIGGIPKGRVIEIYGPESSGKTTVRPRGFW